jgi:hypothetical protein
MSDNVGTDWDKIRKLPRKPLEALFADDPDRLNKMSRHLSVGASDIFFDFSKTHLDDAGAVRF